MKKNIGAIALFGLYTLYYLVLELAINDYAQHVVGSENVTVLFGAGYLMVAIGYLFYPLSQKAVVRGRAGKAAVILAAVSGALAYLALSFTPSPGAFVACTLLTHICAGYIGGAVYARTARALGRAGNLGFALGLGYAGANAVQMLCLVFLLFVPVPVGQALERAMLTAIFLFIAAVLIARPEPGSNPGPIAPATPPALRSYLIGALAAVAILALLQGLNDGIATSLHAGEGDYQVYGIPRLFVIPGLLLAGALADLRDRRFFPFATLTAMVIMSAAIMLFSSPGTYGIATSLIYFFGSFMSIFSIEPFMRWAHETPHPDLACVIGRSARYAFAGIAIIVIGGLFSTASMAVLLICYVVLLAVLFAIFFFMGQLRLPAASRKDASGEYRAFATRYSLTVREEEVLTLLCEGFSTAEIAERLFISEKTARNHIGNMLSKTGQASRAELVEAMRQAQAEYRFMH